MKIGIIGGSYGLAILVGAQLAKRVPHAEVTVINPSEGDLQDVADFQRELLAKPEPIPIKLEPRMIECTPYDYTPSHSRYNRTPKWKRNQSGSKFF